MLSLQSSGILPSIVTIKQLCQPIDSIIPKHLSSLYCHPIRPSFFPLFYFPLALRTSSCVQDRMGPSVGCSSWISRHGNSPFTISLKYSSHLFLTSTAFRRTLLSALFSDLTTPMSTQALCRPLASWIATLFPYGPWYHSRSRRIKYRLFHQLAPIVNVKVKYAFKFSQRFPAETECEEPTKKLLINVIPYLKHLSFLHAWFWYLSEQSE